MRKQNEIEVRIPEHLGRALLATIRHWNTTREPVVFGLVRHASVGAKTLVLVRDLVVPPESAFLASAGHGARWSGAYSIELLNQAIGDHCGLFIFHAHGGRHVALSPDDRTSARELLPMFQMVAPDRPHGSVVIGDDSAAGLVVMPGIDEPFEEIGLRLFDNGIHSWPLPEALDEHRLLFERQPLTECPLLRALLRRTAVAVVGLSGGGSQVACHLVTAGIGEVIAIDDQRVDVDNLAATPALGWIDVRLNVRKTTAARFRTWLIDRRRRFTAVDSRVPSPEAVEALKRADLIVGCVNNLQARADLNEIAWRYCIPYIDVGLGLRTLDGDDEPKRLRSISGNVFSAIPGGPCLWCSGFLTKDRIDAESGGLGRPYMRGENHRTAQVSTFNGTLAAEAAGEVLRLLTQLRGAENDPMRVYEGFAGTLLECAVKKRHACELCTGGLAIGDPVWSRGAEPPLRLQ